MRRLILPLLFGLVGTAILVSLGLWQVDRLAWKEGVLAEIDASMTVAPSALPTSPDPESTRYLPVAMSGVVEPRAVRVLVSHKGMGAGFRIVSPFETEEGRRVLLDRGFVQVSARDTARYAGPLAVIGNLHWPDDRNSSTPENDVAGNMWFARDLDQLARQFDTEPLLVVARATEPEDPGILPLPVDTSGIPNDHLEYAVTWFGLALVWAGMSLYFLWRQLRRGA
ncbi:SURF1 family protein [Poseidonocella sedimentorum]|uniref:SURF1-like protein n=1 Tax=Poseidonocella sedimentorum TaxID=871652 RepID=A0A1I6CPN2_9RHOB|nr:SURF1 family protein [Poseidonocella sedimentorum]SFQ95124.1 surfeit locus 1 family protein [Poseidonocella sedimentorum]